MNLQAAGYHPRKDGELIAMSFISVEDLERGEYYRARHRLPNKEFTR